jgi:signal transduction histidine kinase
MLSWIFIGALFLLCAALGFLQYRWLGDVSLADRERRGALLRSSLFRISQDFNSDLTSACTALIPQGESDNTAETLKAYAARYTEWKRSTSHARIFRKVAVATADKGEAEFHALNLETDAFSAAAWPEEWQGFRERIEARLSSEPGQERRPPPLNSPDQGLIFEIPHFTPRPPEPGGPEERRGPFGRRVTDWLLVEFDAQYLTATILPELLQRHLGAGGKQEYTVEVVSRIDPNRVVFRSDPGQPRPRNPKADAQVGLAEVQFDQIMRAMAPMGWRERVLRGPGGVAGGEPGPRRAFGPDMGRWQMLVQHRAGSLDAVVGAARYRNLAVTAAILLLMLASAFALLRFTTHAQRLAEMQMNFVASVSHELRTPLTVIHTAAYNLRGGVARNPEKVERYGTLIHQESERLGRLVEQVLRFANVNAGRVIREPRPVCVEEVIEDAMEASRAELASSDASVETRIDPGLPLVMGDALALKHALQNLLSNAAKYGVEGGGWIGVYAVTTGGKESPAVEVRVADRGPGIPPDEQKHVFDPFFRGRRAVRDQVHGTGLGLNLVKKIIEAHGGTVRVSSEVMKGTEFIVQIPAAPAEQQDEFTNSASRG